jgi:transposase-like protein
MVVQREEKKLGRIRLKRIADASAESLESAIQETVEPGSLMCTDGWAGYNQIGNKGYVHEVVRTDAAVGDNLLSACNLVASLMKRWLGGTLQGAVSHEHLEYYLDEYTFRLNRRTSRYRGKLFYRLLQQAMVTDAVTYETIKKSVRGRKPTQHNI